jgi:hypothetical protein
MLLCAGTLTHNDNDYHCRIDWFAGKVIEIWLSVT